MSFQIYSRVDDANATTLQSVEVSSAQPTTGALMQYDGSSWAPGPVCGTGYFNPKQGQVSVTCNGMAGKITLEAKSLAGSPPFAPFTFTVFNNYVKNTDIVLVNVQYAVFKKDPGPLQITIDGVGNGSMRFILVGAYPTSGSNNIQVFFQILRPQ
jgi:hypothetical protein